MKRRWKWIVGILIIVVTAAAVFIGRMLNDPRNADFVTWRTGDAAERAELITVQREPCPGAPFLLPAEGFIGLLWNDPRGPYSLTRRHQGIDIFVDFDIPLGTVPVVAVADGYVTRESDWTSTVILRVPDDPLQPGRQIWVYYTHMADEQGNDYIEPAFDRGVREVFVEQGTILGYIGNYDGNVPSRIWPHVHLSIVQDDGNGMYLNEYFSANTYDPSPYFGVDVNYGSAEGAPATCAES